MNTFFRFADGFLTFVIVITFLIHVYFGEWEIAGVLLTYLVWCAVKDLAKRPIVIQKLNTKVDFTDPAFIHAYKAFIEKLGYRVVFFRLGKGSVPLKKAKKHGRS